MDDTYLKEGPRAETSPDQDRPADREVEELRVRLEEIQAAARMGYWELDVMSGRLKWSNQEFKLHGLEPGQITPTVEAAMGFVHAGDRDRVSEVLERTLTTGQPGEVDFWITRKDGEDRFLRLRCAPAVPTDGGRPERIKGTCQDITDCKRVEDKLQEQLSILTTLLDTIPSPIFYKDVDGRFQGCNRAYEEAIGIKKKDIIGKTVFDIAPGEMAEKYHSMDADLFKNPGVQVYESPVQYSTGERREMIANKGTYSKADGTVAGLVGVLTDITERKRAEEALRFEHDRLKGIMESMRDGMYIANRAYEIEYVNPAFREQFGEVGGRKCYEYFQNFTSPCSWCRNVEVFAGKTVHWECYVEKLGKTYEMLDIPLRNADGSMSKLEIAHDVTEYKKALKEKEEMQAQLLQSQKMEAIGTLAGGIAHDFNNIMTVIKNLSTLAIGKTGEDDPMRGYLNPICDISERAINLVQQLLIFSRNRPVSFETLYANDTVGELVSMLEHLISEDINIECDLDTDTWAVKGDKGRVEQLITNLVLNASDAMPRGGTVVLRTRNVSIDEEFCRSSHEARTGDFVLLTVEDTGTGMDKEVLERIFEPFFTTKATGSTGLGLAVVYGIVKEHSGWIRVDSEPGHGTTFSIYLPSAEVGANAERIEARAREFNGRGRRILLVEDDKWLRKSTAMVLSENGYEVFEASNAENAISLFYREKGRFDLVISDVVMPGRSGLQMVSPLLDINPSIPILLCSGHLDDKAQLSEIIKRGLAYLQKPYDIPELLVAVEETITHNDGDA